MVKSAFITNHIIAQEGTSSLAACHWSNYDDTSMHVCFVHLYSSREPNRNKPSDIPK